MDKMSLLLKAAKRAGKMAQPVKAIAAKPDNLRSIPRTHMVKVDPSCPLTLVNYPHPTHN